MSRLNRLLVGASLTLFMVGCGGSSAPPTAEEKQQMESDMATDMEQMTGNISEIPGAGQTKGEAPEGN